MGEELWLAKERVANQDRELGELHRQLEGEKSESARLRNQIEEEKRKVLFTSRTVATPTSASVLLTKN